MANQATQNQLDQLNKQIAALKKANASQTTTMVVQSNAKPSEPLAELVEAQVAALTAVVTANAATATTGTNKAIAMAGAARYAALMGI
jgi:phage I-like protein